MEPQQDESLVDEASEESFPASDAPSWSAAHAGTPGEREQDRGPQRGLEREAILADVERLRSTAGAQAVEDAVARSMLDAGRSIVREPAGKGSARNVEAQIVGMEPGAPNVVVAAKQGDATSMAMLLATMRALLGGPRPWRSVHFAALVDTAGWIDRRRREGTRVRAVLVLESLGLAAAGADRKLIGRLLGIGDGALLIVTDPARRHLAFAARGAFRSRASIDARALVLPSWLPPMRRSDLRAFHGAGWPAIVATDGAPLRDRAPSDAFDADRMSAALPGLAAIVERLASERHI